MFDFLGNTADNFSSQTHLWHICSFMYSCYLFELCISGTSKWADFGEGGLLWGECSSRHSEWFDGNPVSDLLVKV